MTHDVARMKSKSTARFKELIHGFKDSHRDFYWRITQTQ